MNVLLTSVGRRAYMVKYFKEALENGGQVHVCNSEPCSIAFKYADKSVVSPLIYDKQYIPFLLGYCIDNKIDIVVSLFDIDLLILAKNKEYFEQMGISVIVSDQNIIEICNDKWQTYNFLKSNGFNVPETYLSLNDVKKKILKGELKYPIVVKPRFGCGSISVDIAYCEEDIDYLSRKVDRIISDSYLKYESSATNDRIIYQEYLQGQEYGADIINDLNGTNQGVNIRKKLAMRSGETDIAELIKFPMLENELEKLSKITGHIANMDCDIFISNNVPYILEMNARFGGGYPFSHMGGCNLPLAIVKWAKGEKVDKEILASKTEILVYKEIYITKM